MIAATGFGGSGTTAITKALHQLGVLFEGPYLGEIESAPARKVNQAALTALTGTSQGWTVPSPQEIWNYSNITNVNIVGVNWKDPRGCITLPIWKNQIEKVIWIHRKKENAIATMNKKCGMESEGVSLLFDIYNSYLDLWLKVLQLPYIETHYEDWYKRKNIKKVRDVLVFCEVNKSDKEILSVLNEMRRPQNT